MVLTHNIRPRLHRSRVCKWMIWYSINSAHSFITCVIAIDLPEAASGGLCGPQSAKLYTPCDTLRHPDVLYRKYYDVLLPRCMESQWLCMQIQITVIDGKGFRLRPFFFCFDCFLNEGIRGLLDGEVWWNISKGR